MNKQDSLPCRYVAVLEHEASKMLCFEDEAIASYSPMNILCRVLTARAGRAIEVGTHRDDLAAAS